MKCKKKREMITACLDLYMNGMSLRKVATHVNQFSDKEVSHMSILRWIRRYVMTIKPFISSLNLSLSGVYHADEIYIKCNKEQHYLFALIDKETRFLVATHYAKEKGLDGAKGLFRKTRQRAEKPIYVFTDGLPAYMNTIPKTWYSNRVPKDNVQHIRIIDRHDYRNNMIERIQGTIRERVKVMRGFKNSKSAEQILEMFVIWYNFLRVHQGIDMIPAQKAGVELNLGKEKWLNLIYRSKIKLSSTCQNK
ncbi:MAG: DDE-type integrase/transposase/recombinase [Candidatus Aenigmarchaeota archaeon]|nr:DDE-type integrase/transposase/recombinase [Candidatus Aenigmarchaeota archaeon]